jgi:AcrR family transcriptional regulator
MSRDRAILDAAAEAFYEKGFHGVGVDELGARAGLSGPSLYRHFSGKDEILATLLNEAMDELISATVPVHDDPELDLQRAVRHHVDFAIGHRHLVNLYQREVRSLAEPWKRQFDRRRSLYTDRWESLFGRRFPALDQPTVVAVTQACLGMIFSLSYWPGRTLQGVDVEALLLRLLLHGLGSFEPTQTNG